MNWLFNFRIFVELSILSYFLDSSFLTDLKTDGATGGKVRRAIDKREMGLYILF